MVQMGVGIGQGLGALLNGGNAADFGSSLMQSLGFSGEGTSKFVNDVKSALESASTPNEMTMLRAQQAQEQMNRTLQTLSNIMRAHHDMRMNIIRNMRA